MYRTIATMVSVLAVVTASGVRAVEKETFKPTEKTISQFLDKGYKVVAVPYGSTLWNVVLQKGGNIVFCKVDHEQKLIKGKNKIVLYNNKCWAK